MNDNPTRSLSSWSRFAVDSRVPSGVTLEIHRRNTTVTVSVPLTDSYVLIGNTPQCGVRLDDDAIRGIQYGLFWLNGELYGVDLRGNIPDHPEFTVADGWWTDGQSLWLGDFQLHVRGLPGRPAPMVPIDDHSMVTLHVDSPVGAQQWPLTRWLTLIGSAVEHGVLIRDAVIAPRQAALIRTPTSLWLVNLAQDLPPRMMSRKVSWSSLDPLDEFSFGETKCHAVTTWPENGFAADEPLPPFDISETVVQVAGDREHLIALHAQLSQMLSETSPR